MNETTRDQRMPRAYSIRKMAPNTPDGTAQKPVLSTLVGNRWTRTRLRAETEGEIDFDKVVHAATVGWRDADKPFSVEALSGFLEDYPLASRAIATEFLAAQTQAKQKN